MKRLTGKKGQSIYSSIYLYYKQYKILRRLQAETDLSYSNLIRAIIDFIEDKKLTEEFKEYIKTKNPEID